MRTESDKGHQARGLPGRHGGRVQEEMPPSGGGAGTLYSAPYSRGSTKRRSRERSNGFKVAVTTSCLSSEKCSRSPRARIFEVLGKKFSYRSWLEKVRNERPAYLTITSLELPECPIPLIESQASARSRGTEESPRSNPDRDVVLDEFLEKVSRLGRDRDKDPSGNRSFRTASDSKRTSTRRRRPPDRFLEMNECNAQLESLQECTERIVAGPTRYKMRPSTSQPQVFKDCICSEISENLRVNIREKTEVTTRGSRSPSPEVTHTIRIAMKYHGQSECKAEGSGEARNTCRREDDREETEYVGKDAQCPGNKSSRVKEDGCCPGVNLALDFTLNCSSVQLTSRDISLKTGTNAATNQDKDAGKRWD